MKKSEKIGLLLAAAGLGLIVWQYEHQLIIVSVGVALLVVGGLFLAGENVFKIIGLA